MTCTPAIVAILNATTPVSSLVGTRIFPNHIPAQVKTYPMIVMQVKPTSEPGESMAGPSGIYSQFIEFVCLSRTYDGATILANAVEAALVGKPQIVGSLKLVGIYLDDEADSDEGLADTGEAFEVYQKTLSLNIWFRSAS